MVFCGGYLAAGLLTLSAGAENIDVATLWSLWQIKKNAGSCGVWRGLPDARRQGREDTMSIMTPQPQHNNPFRRHLQLRTSSSLLSIAVAAAVSAFVSSVSTKVAGREGRARKGAALPWRSGSAPSDLKPLWMQNEGHVDSYPKMKGRNSYINVYNDYRRSV